MIHTYFKVILLASTTLFVACDSTRPMEFIYSDREKFTFMSDGEEYIYLCTKSSTEKPTKERARQAHEYFIRKLDGISEEFADNLIGDLKDSTGEEDENEGKKDDDFSILNGIKATIKLQEQVKVLGAEVEKKYQCLFID